MVTEQGLARAHRIANPVERPAKRLYSVKEAAHYLGRSVYALREMLWAGKLPYIKDGRRILLDIKDMDAWAEKNKVQFDN
jgi:excisionase family DNA binding protein